MTRLAQTIPALPVADLKRAAEFFGERLGFELLYADEGFAAVGRDEAVIHLWQASDEQWRDTFDPARPIGSGAESFLAGTASCRVSVEGVDDLYRELRAQDVLHPVSKAGVTDTEFGTREFATLDLDGNLITFFERQ